MMDGPDDANIFIIGDINTKWAGGTVFRKIIIDRFKYAKKQQANTNASSKHHGDPTGIGIIRFCVFAADLDLADRVKNQ